MALGKVFRKAAGNKGGSVSEALASGYFEEGGEAICWPGKSLRRRMKGREKAPCPTPFVPFIAYAVFGRERGQSAHCLKGSGWESYHPNSDKDECRREDRCRSLSETKKRNSTARRESEAGGNPLKDGEERMVRLKRLHKL